jgi:gluconolactonase
MTSSSTASTTTGSQGGAGGSGGQAEVASTSGPGGAGASGAAGATGGAGGAAGSGDAGVKDGGAGGAPADATSDAPTKHFVCPAGPFPKPAPGQAQAVCAGFRFNYTYNEGPTWIPSQGAFFFSNFPQGQPTGGDIIRYTPGGSCEVFLHDVGCNGLALSPSGNIMAACQQSRSVMEFDVVTKTSSVLADMYMGKMLDSPNDLVAHSNGSIYFSNPNYELGGRPPGIGPALFWRDPKGALTLVGMGEVNGVTLSADERTLYVVAGGAWDLDPTGRPSNNRPSFANGDGIATDCDGNVYSSLGTITSPQGQSQGTFQGGTNLAFGGPDGMTLLVVGGGTNVRTIRMNLPGFP